ncbi:cadherin-like beta sandwich domain-containing protein [Flammeovirga aprica]|uniref:Cadherin-like beta sandwich domain-containing protein n=1 Tax=Flammeovirga aprica JL-4 TaxID=694437 RepID=A0A7X9RU68_9BACT|nr:cadherin-like beta sandwich domain-containing protein [Flammeovirga aprica]NME68775.1 cadherin-like beta sandwich domain-containing protein [Flammeovirga aprica JL-4]
MKYLFTKLILGIMMLSSIICSQSVGQVVAEKVRAVPTIDGDATTEFLFLEHLIATKASDSGQDLQISDTQIEASKPGAYVEYQVKSTAGGDFLVVILAGTEKDNAQLNVGAYKTTSETWPAEGLGETQSILNTNNWAHQNPYYFPLTLEADEVYTVRINYVNTVANDWICNIHGISFEESTGSVDATLKSLTIDGTALEGFDPAVTSYDVPLPIGASTIEIAAEANDANAKSVAGTGEVTITDNVTPVTITVTSESDTQQEYVLNFFKPIEVTVGATINGFSDAYHNSGIAGNDSKLNNIQNGDYIEYYVYSATDQDIQLKLICSNGYDTPNSFLNISTYPLGSDWTLNEELSYNIPFTSWGRFDDRFIEGILSFNANEVSVLRIYGITDQNNAADIFELSFTEAPAEGVSTDATLSTLTVNDVEIEGFNPDVIQYTVALPFNTTSVKLGAVANDAAAQGIEGLSDNLTISEGKTTASIVVTAESGAKKTYTVDFVTPIEIVNNKALDMQEDAYYYKGMNVIPGRLNSTKNGTYIEYYVYSATDLNVTMKVNCTNGYDTPDSYLNVSTYELGGEWTLDPAKSYNVPFVGVEGDWTQADDRNVNIPVMLTANTPVVLRLYCVTTTGNAANIYGISFEENVGSTDATLSTLTVNDVEIEGFDPEKISYRVVLPMNTSSVKIGGTANDAAAQGVEGLSDDFMINEGNTSTTIVVTAESGTRKEYTINFVTPIQVAVDKALDIQEDVYHYEGLNVIPGRVNETKNKTFIEYYVYSPVDAEFSFNIQCTNGFDTPDSYLNVSTYEMGTDWELDPSKSYNVPFVGVDGDWTPADDRFINAPIALKANTPAIVRVYCLASTTNAANIYGFKFLKAEKSADATLSDIKIDDVSVYDFDPATFTYDVLLSNETTSVNITAETNNAKATITSGLGAIAIDSDQKQHEIVVSAENGDEKTYTINFTKIALSVNTNLSDLQVNNVTVENFDPMVLNYDVTLPAKTTSVVVGATLADNASEILEGVGEVTLTEYETEHVITVEAEAGNKKDYVINFIVLKSEVATLSDLQIDGATVTGFDAATQTYDVTLPAKTTSVDIAATATDADAMIDGVGTIALDAYEVSHSVVVTAESGNTMEYTINFTVLKSEVATLSDLQIDGATVTGFDAATQTYDVTLPAKTSSVEIAATATDADAMIDGVGTITLDAYAVSHSVVVTAEAGNTMEYTINFTVLKSEVATLSDLQIDGATVTGFDAATQTYDVTLAAKTSSVEIATTATDADAMVNGIGTIALDAYEVSHSIVVTAEAGNTMEYSINFTVLKSEDATLSDLQINGETIAGFDKSVKSYEVVLTEISTMVIGATASDIDADVSGLGEIILSEGELSHTVTVTAEAGNTEEYVINFKVSIVSSIDVAQEYFKVIASVGTIQVNNLKGGEQIAIYDLEGRQIKNLTATSGAYATTMARGIYLVVVGNHVSKVFVQ